MVLLQHLLHPRLRRRRHRSRFGRRVRLEGQNPAGVLAVLKNEKFKNPDKKKEIEKLLNSISNQLFDQLVSIGRLITDYQDRGDAATPALTDGNEEALDDDEEEEESENEDEEGQEQNGFGAMQMGRIDDDDLEEANVGLALNVQDIDAYWLQRKISQASTYLNVSHGSPPPQRWATARVLS